jgi:hypothetical protein
VAGMCTVTGTAQQQTQRQVKPAAHLLAQACTNLQPLVTLVTKCTRNKQCNLLSTSKQRCCSCNTHATSQQKYKCFASPLWKHSCSHQNHCCS